MKKLFFLIYSFLWTLVIPLAKKHKRLKQGYSERLLEVDYIQNANNLAQAQGTNNIIIYASSGGEALLAQNFIKKIAKNDDVFYCFAWTKEGVDVFKSFASKNNNLKIKTYFTPFDKPVIIEKALASIAPTHCYIIETEIWFGVLNALTKQSIPFSFVNARMTEKSLKGLKKVSCLLKDFPPSEIQALSQNDLNRFAEVFQIPNNSSRLKVVENLKFESARELLAGANLANLTSQNKANSPAVLFASVRDEEYEDILYCVEEIRKNDADITIIICPKHLSQAKLWAKAIEINEAIGTAEKALFANSVENITPADIEKYQNEGKNLFIWDVFGQLKQLYAYADIVFVGGSLKPLGGQNFLEPIAYGNTPYVGEYLDNFLWVFEKQPDLREIHLVKQISSKEQLKEAIIEDVKAFDANSIANSKQEVQQNFAKWLN